MKKNILLTGDSRGLGLSIKKQLQLSGYNVIGLSRTSEDVRYDLSNTDGIKNVYLNTISQKGPIYGFINNAAFAYDDIISNTNSEKLLKMFKINVIVVCGRKRILKIPNTLKTKTCFSLFKIALLYITNNVDQVCH